jgi:hypothetical protein
MGPRCGTQMLIWAILRCLYPGDAEHTLCRVAVVKHTCWLFQVSSTVSQRRCTQNCSSVMAEGDLACMHASGKQKRLCNVCLRDSPKSTAAILAAHGCCSGGPNLALRPQIVSRCRTQWANCDHQFSDPVEPILPLSAASICPLSFVYSTVVLWALAATVHGSSDVCDMPTDGTAVSCRLAMHCG